MTAKETRQSAAHNVRGVDPQKRTVDVIASTYDLDSYQTRIDPAGWDLEQFKKNPVICLQHDASGMSPKNGLPVANALPETIRTENGKLLMRLQFPAEGKFPLADQVFHLIADGFLRGISVGFDPVDWEDQEEEDGDGYKTKVRIFRKQKLMEVSIVTIPANDNALVQRARQLNRESELEAIRARIGAVERMAEELGASEVAEGEKTDAPVTTEPEVPPATDTTEAGEAPIEAKEEKSLGQVKVQVRVEDLAAFQKLQEEISKYRTYFEKKQPANKASTIVLKKFYERVLQEDPPADEVKAWQRMGEAVEALEEVAAEATKTAAEPTPAETKVEEPGKEPAAPAETETPKEEPAPTPVVNGTTETTVEVKQTPPAAPAEEPPSTPTQPAAAEAPQRGREAPVLISFDLRDLGAFQRNFKDTLCEIAVEALRRGIPPKEVDSLIDSAGKQFLTHILPH